MAEVVALLFSKEAWEGIYEYRKIYERIMYVKVKRGDRKMVVVSLYAPQTNKEKEKERFWRELGDCIETFKRDESVMAVGDMNAKV